MKLNTYQKTAITTVFATLLLIFVGGLVRAAGAGLGCPDWPRCFGMWIPPTSAADLPPGFDISEFNVFKTWTEYINRLVGVVIGLLITATFLLSFRYREKEPVVFYSSAGAFVLVLVQGWLGGRVVITGLDAWLITLHMILAMIIVNVLLYAAFKATSGTLLEPFTLPASVKKWLFWGGVTLLGLTLVQLVMGTQVREAVDIVKGSVDPPPRALWLDDVGWIDEAHRIFSWMVLIAGGGLFYLSKWKAGHVITEKITLGILMLIVIQMLLGAGLYYLGMPPAYQVFHLFFGAVLICLEFLLLLVLKGERE